MPRRHPPVLPTRWLFTDQRLDGPLFAIVARLAPGSGIVVRHDHLPPAMRWRLLRRLMRIAKVRKLTVVLAGSPSQAVRWGADGVHLRQQKKREAAQALRLGLYLTMPAHSRGEARAARRAGADLVFVSPLYPTRSHQGAEGLGGKRFAQVARVSGAQVVALGGMNDSRGRALRLASLQSGFVPGWAAIDYWVEAARKRQPHQKRN